MCSRLVFEYLNYVHFSGPCGAMDNASAYGAEDSRFESWQGRTFLNVKFSLSISAPL